MLFWKNVLMDDALLSTVLQRPDADPNVKNSEGKSPLYLAWIYRCEKGFALLLKDHRMQLLQQGETQQNKHISMARIFIRAIQTPPNPCCRACVVLPYLSLFLTQVPDAADRPSGPNMHSAEATELLTLVLDYNWLHLALPLIRAGGVDARLTGSTLLHLGARQDLIRQSKKRQIEKRGGNLFQLEPCYTWAPYFLNGLGSGGLDIMARDVHKNTAYTATHLYYLTYKQKQTFFRLLPNPKCSRTYLRQAENWALFVSHSWGALLPVELQTYIKDFIFDPRPVPPPSNAYFCRCPF